MSLLKFKNLFLILFYASLFWLSACGTFTTVAPYAQVESPEVAKPKVAQWNLVQVRGAEKYYISNDASKRPPTINDTNEQSMSNSTTASALFEYTPIENLSAGLLYGDESGINFKYQFLNSPGQNPDSYHLASVYTHFSRIYSNTSGDQNGNFGAGGYKWDAYSNSQNWNIGVSFGYRKNPEILYYLGVAHNQLSMDAKINHQQSSDNSSPAAQYQTQQTGRSNTISLGIVSGEETQFEVSLNYSDMFYGSTHRYNTYFNLGISEKFENLFEKNENLYNVTPKDYWTGKDFIAVPIGLYVGFGTGQAIQGNWKTKGKYFALVDSSSLLMMLSSFNKSSTATGGFGSAVLIWGVSRIWQIVDTIVDASSSERRTLKVKIN